MLTSIGQVIDAVHRRGQLAQGWTRGSAAFAVHTSIIGILMSASVDGDAGQFGRGLAVVKQLVESLRAAPVPVPVRKKARATRPKPVRQ